MPLPSNVGTGTVTGRFIDSAGENVEGTVKFVLSATKLLNISDALGPVTILATIHEVPLVDGAFTVDLMATNDADNNPIGWTWQALFFFQGGVTLAAFSFELPEGTTVDLTEVAPVGSDEGVTIIRGPGIPTGGTTGQVPVKASDDDYDLEWADQTAGSGAVDSVNGEVGQVVLTADHIGDGVTAAQMLLTERAKLAAVAEGATANDTDANLKARGNHTGTQAQSTVTGLVTDLAGKADSAHGHIESDVAGLTAALAAKANDVAVVKLTGGQTIAGIKTFSDAPVVPDGSFTAAKISDFDTQVTAAVEAVVDGAPGALDTLNEIAAALGDDANYAATTTATLATKAADNAVVKLTGDQTVAGVKTFSSAPAVPDSSFPVAKTAGLQAALDLKAPIASPTFTGTVNGVTKAMVGLTNVDNTADSAKPVSVAQQAALDLKAPLASPTFTGAVSGVTKTHVGLGNVDNTADSAKPVSTAQQTALDLKLNTTIGTGPTAVAYVVVVANGAATPAGLPDGTLVIELDA